MNIIETVQNWLHPLPEPKTAATLEAVITAARQIDPAFDVSIEWVQSPTTEEGHYIVRPVRYNCCSIASTQEPATARATREVIANELRAHLTRDQAMLAQHQADAEPTIARFNGYIRRIHEEPNAPVDRDFLREIFSEREIGDVTPHSPRANEAIPSISRNRTSRAPASVPFVTQPRQTELSPLIQEEPHETQQPEVRELVNVVNYIKMSSARDSLERMQLLNRMLKNQKRHLERLNSNISTRRNMKSTLPYEASISTYPTNMQLEERLSPQEERIARTLSQKTIQLISTIRVSSKNWINESLEDQIPLIIETASSHITHQFPNSF